jgi:hypothetical protein
VDKDVWELLPYMAATLTIFGFATIGSLQSEDQSKSDGLAFRYTRSWRILK